MRGLYESRTTISSTSARLQMPRSESAARRASMIMGLRSAADMRARHRAPCAYKADFAPPRARARRGGDISLRASQPCCCVMYR